jgi:hypothetical protein
MKLILVGAVVMTSFWVPAAMAQVPKVQGYGFYAYGPEIDESRRFGHIGVGGSGAVWKGVSVGAEIGAIYFTKPNRGVLPNVQAGGGYHFRAGKPETKWDPFVTAGYAVFVNDGLFSSPYFGGGAVYWLRPHLGIRFEFRHQAVRDWSRDGYPEFRIGISF